MTRTWRRGAALLLLSAAVLAGCCPRKPTVMVSRAQLVSEYNANASPVPRLWARAKIELNLFTPEGQWIPWGSLLGPPNGLLLLQKNAAGPLAPADFVLIGKEAGQEVFRLGNSVADRSYYLWYQAGSRAGGAYVRTDLPMPAGTGDIAINPLQLLWVLCVTELPTDFTRLPLVLLSLDDSDCHNRAYVLTWVDCQGTAGACYRMRMYFHWDDKLPRRPFRMDLLDEVGRVVTTARVSDWKPIEMADLDDEPAAPSVMPTDIDIRWPGNGSRLRIRLSEMTTADTFAPEAFLLFDRLPADFPPENLVPQNGPRPREPGR